MEQRRLSFTNRWMFNRVMLEEPICRKVIEAALGIKVEHIEYLNAEQVMEPDPTSHGIRMDVYARESGRMYDVEMQIDAEPCLGRRFRYYQSSLDAHELPQGADYDELPESFIIFICCTDPFRRGLPVYHLERTCCEMPEMEVGDGSHWMVLNAHDWGEVDGGGLFDLLRCIGTGETAGALSREIDRAVTRANADRKWVGKVWSVSTIEENDARRRRIELRMARTEGREEGLEEGRGLGAVQGEARFAALADRLLEAGRLDDLKRASVDAAFRGALFKELSL
ncbi:Rpn family recombination-promoting nuclease/putative transposase [Adlercreutzia mucosicola]|uniref:Rpn family recombination-promoting nuclease/putative transposase n=1 Tax=Adlercreutzia mucosicola TaxID=580026 RepID=UPI002B245BA4|nr:Rpn family recombination-promoting nuclease/putative transposase [Adlercreutzia mucosicola]MEB1813699.1 Rpn family recombination-promoting nuclease/putative transposase [Adlercreutzia mucosicola]